MLTYKILISFSLTVIMMLILMLIMWVASRLNVVVGDYSPSKFFLLQYLPFWMVEW